MSDSPSSGQCTIVVPCYNEEQRLPIADFREFISAATDVRFLFVNDGSTDGTLKVLQGLQAEFPHAVDVLNQIPNQGKAEAVRSGVLHAIQTPGTLFVGYWDADLATPLRELPRLLNVIVERPCVELLLGSRVKLLGRHVHRKPVRHYSGRIFATLASITLELPVYDTQCGSKLFRVTPTLEHVFATPFCSRWIFDVEILARYLHIHTRDRERAIAAIYEEPLQIWEDVSGSKLKPQDSFIALGDLLQIRRTYFSR